MAVFYDVFNGDADGICALQQLRLVEPRTSTLITGVKRDIALLDRVHANKGDAVTVLDVSLDRNGDALRRILKEGASCLYFDHHHAGAIPRHRRLVAHIDTAPEVCTSLLVDRYLSGACRAWAVVAAFGDNLVASARSAALPLELNEAQLAQLQALGESINYNAYGDTIDDLNYDPADLYQVLSGYRDPFDFISGEPVFEVLHGARLDDIYRAGEIVPQYEDVNCAVYVLPNEAWSRRVSGSFGNQIAQEHPERAHAVLTQKADGYVVSVRTALERPGGAADLCRQFGGGGRALAGGIDTLAEGDFDRFVQAFRAALGAAR
jgi:hypothetical protein